MPLSLPSVNLPSRTGLMVMAGAGVAGVFGLLSTPVALLIAAVPMVGANIPDDNGPAPVRRARSAATTVTSPARRTPAKRSSAAPRATAKRTTTPARPANGRRGPRRGAQRTSGTAATE